MILVTGASGNVGGELVKRLAAMKAGFRAGYRSKEKAEKAKASGIAAVVLDFGKPESLREALDGVQRVFLVSGNAPDQGALETNVVRAAGKAGVRHIVKTSVWGAEKELFSFAKLHRPVERMIEDSGVAWTFLRPNGYMQNVSNFYAPTIRSSGTFYLAAGQARVSHIDVRDIAAVAAAILTGSGHEDKAYDLSGPEALTYDDVALKLTAAIGRKVAYVAVTDADLKKGMVDAGLPAAYADALIDLLHYYIAGHAARVSPAVRQITGKDPISFDQFARDYAQVFT